jgi:hypothetical protein
LKGVDEFNATKYISTLRFSTVQQLSIRRFNAIQSWKRLSRLSRPLSCLIRPLLANAIHIRWPKLARMDSDTKNERRGGGRAYRSRLEPFAEFIRQQRQQRKTWQEIATLLRTEKGCSITFQGLHQFYRRYLKRQARSHWESEALTAQPATVKSPASAQEPAQEATTTSTRYKFKTDI